MGTRRPARNGRVNVTIVSFTKLLTVACISYKLMSLETILLSSFEVQSFARDFTRLSLHQSHG